MDREREVKREALKQYLKYFRFWFAGAAVMLVAAIAVNVARSAQKEAARGNQQAPAERVYDYADVLTDAQEDELRQKIAEYEQRAHADLILVTIDTEVGRDDYTWEQTMMSLADGIYDQYAYGWNKPYGDGALLLDNWYEDENGSQKGSWLSTSGRMEDIIGSREEGKVFDAMYVHIDRDPYKAYAAALSKLAEYGAVGSSGPERAGRIPGGIAGAAALSFAVSLVYALIHLWQSQAKDTTNALTYVNNGKVRINNRRDDFLRKNVVSHRIETSSGGGHSHSGGGSHGHHVSSGGHSHGGGGRRR